VILARAGFSSSARITLSGEQPMTDQAGWTCSLHALVPNEVFGGILPLALAAAMIWPNSPWADAWHATVTFGSDRLRITESLQHWINDGPMAIFFLRTGDSGK
jgi:Na+/H+ antiporter NhaA